VTGPRRQVSIVGGGRWAATIASVICERLPQTHAVTLHSPNNAAGLVEWRRQYPDVTVQDRLPDYAGAKPHAVIVANAAADHAEAAAQALAAGVPVLVEKPIALSAQEAQNLVDLSAKSGAALCASNVFLFASYLDVFAARVRSLPRIERVRFVWADLKAEVRWGMRKRYDPALTVTDDIIPHVVPILGLGLGFDAPALDGVTLMRGGAEVALDLRLGAVSGHVVMARDGDVRRRVIEVEGGGVTASLDFAQEPGAIEIGGVKAAGDPDWSAKPGPLATMLLSFLRAVGGARFDPRLDASHAVAALRLADEVRPVYLERQRQWLVGADSDDAGRGYAARERDARQGLR
jgi:predicted dehydrogenase